MQKFSTTTNKRFILNKSQFVEFNNYRGSIRERIIWPTKNFPSLIPDMASELNELTKYAFCGRALGTHFIQSQLIHTKFLDVYRDKKSGAICEFVRLDVYEDIPSLPISVGIFKLPGYSCEIRNPLGQLILRELTERVAISNPNPSVINVNCAFNPRGYEMCKNLCDKIIPDFDLIYESMDQYLKSIYKKLKPEKAFKYFETLFKEDILIKDTNSDKITFNLRKMRLFMESIDKTEKASIDSEFPQIFFKMYDLIIKSIAKQTSEAIKIHSNIDVMIKFYISKMEQSTGLDLPFVQSRSTLIGCIPVPERIVSNLNAYDEKITDFFNALLNIQNGDMLLFYSKISYEQLRKKLNYRY